MRKKDIENREKGKQQTEVIVEGVSPEPKTKINNDEKSSLATNDKQKINRQEKSEGKSPDSDSDWEIERTTNKRKYSNYSQNAAAVHRANEAFNDLEFDITRAARKWARRTEEKLKKKHKTEEEGIPYEVLYGSSHKALFKHYQRKLTKKHQNKFQTSRIHAANTDSIEDENKEPPTQKEKNKTKKTQGKKYYPFKN
ncbi:hypothetical protein JTB14_000928 [Gonioctena quinquepunctata]|nr:hypothetical protein JTB14_000928 [Gonioctena quinquepunctata]